jgi:hypothetical protein
MEEKSQKIKRKYKKRVNEHTITYDNYEKHEINLKNYQIGDLKRAIKELGNIRLTGTKPQLIERITRRFVEIKHSILIQKIFRGWYLRLIQKLRGPALKNRNMCTNDCDMATLEPLNEIATTSFFSYKDNNEFVYGFDVSSLIPHIQSKGKFINPYTRESVSKQIARNAFRVYRGSYAMFSEFRKDNKKLESPSQKRQYTTRSMLSIQQRMNSLRNHFNESPNRSAFTRIQTNLQSIRNLPVNERIRRLFVEIDQLGNYTQYSWFNDLPHRGLVLFYRGLYDIWYFRAGLTFTVKRNICYGVGYNAVSPFTRHFNVGYREISFIDYDELRTSCLEVFEHLVYCGIDTDHKKLGTLHALSALTLVSTEARNAMPWLYESVA